MVNEAIPDSEREISEIEALDVNVSDTFAGLDHPEPVVSATETPISKNQEEAHSPNVQDSGTGENLLDDLTSQGQSIEYSEASTPHLEAPFTIRAILGQFIEGLLFRSGELHSILTRDITFDDFMTILKGRVQGQLSLDVLAAPNDDALRNEIETVVDGAISEIRSMYPTAKDNISTVFTKLREGFAEVERDQEELKRHIAERKRWDENAASFCSAMNKVVDSANIFLESEVFPNLTTSISEDIKLIQGRIEGIKLVQKMILLLPQKAEEVVIDRNQTSQSDFCSSRYLEDSIEGLLKNVSHHNYGLVTEMRQVADRCRNLFFSFLNKHYFVILDALEDGKRSLTEFESSFSNIPNYSDFMQNFLNIYDELIDRMEACLKEFNISPIAAVRGAEVDYYIHEPFDVQSDQELQTGQVYDLIHKGYEFLEKLYGDRNYVIRRAKVRVVKN